MESFKCIEIATELTVGETSKSYGKFCLDKHMNLYMMKAKMKMKIELEDGVLKSFIHVCVCACVVFILHQCSVCRGQRHQISLVMELTIVS